METYNLYMDEISSGSEQDGEGTYEVQFRIVPNSIDDGDPENNAVLANLNLLDLIDLRDAIQQMIDEVAMSSIEAELEAQEQSTAEEELTP